MTERPSVTIYTDGGSDPNPGPGGWAAILIDDATGHQKELSGADPATTNNRMELTAAIEALRALKQPCAVTLYTDSSYLKNGITQWLAGWMRKGWTTASGDPVQNSDLWQGLRAETARHQITWQWVRGHAGNQHNERADHLATAARLALTGGPAIKPTVAGRRLDAPQADSPATAPDYAIALRVSVPKTDGPGGYAFRTAPAADMAPGRVHTGRDPRTSAYALTLHAAAEALRTLPEGVTVRFFCPDDVLYKGMTEWISGWQRRGWRNASNKPVAHRALWETLLAEASARRVLWQMEPDPRPALARGLETLARQAADS